MGGPRGFPPWKGAPTGYDGLSRSWPAPAPKSSGPRRTTRPVSVMACASVGTARLTHVARLSPPALASASAPAIAVQAIEVLEGARPPLGPQGRPLDHAGYQRVIAGGVEVEIVHGAPQAGLDALGAGAAPSRRDAGWGSGSRGGHG
jgi:hypothetical protein